MEKTEFRSQTNTKNLEVDGENESNQGDEGTFREKEKQERMARDGLEKVSGKWHKRSYKDQTVKAEYRPLDLAFEE